MGQAEVDNRPSWHVLYMTMAFQLCTRSLDPRTKHGCFVVASDYSPLSFGFNSPPQGCDDANIPLEAPAKYDFMAHSEQNAIDNAAKKGIALDNSIFYITGFPCPRCFQSIRRVGAKKIIYGPVGSAMIAQKDIDAVDIMNTDKNGDKIIQFIRWIDIVPTQFKNKSLEKRQLIEEALANIRNVQDTSWGYIQTKCFRK